ncbi:UPF0758 domain-containing protein [Spiroplasma endosymbiont of Dilophus febrilis]|uniref:UPF0758 domain-containing protein n=1 Tax=Spiroplasma endosymbiont of Dilophus febrilis TaxID=3066292 RepID=UPI00313D0C47
MKFKDIPINERPREKAWKNGIKNLSNNELLALLLRTGNKKQNVLQLAQYIINHFNAQQADIGLPGGFKVGWNNRDATNIKNLETKLEKLQNLYNKILPPFYEI